MRRRNTILLALVSSTVAAVYFLTPPSFSALERQGNDFIQRIEEFHDTQGRYPTSAQEAQINLPQTRYGPWKYRLGDGGTEYSLSVGEYDGWDPFVLSWSSAKRQWYRDI